MYRDTAPTLDEHDRAVGAILIGQALIEDVERAVARTRRPDTEQERWRALTDVSDTYPEIWRHLDRARRELSRRGITTAGYDDLRPHTARAATHDETIDMAAVDDARRALAELKLALPGADWEAIDKRTAGLVNAPLPRSRRMKIVLGVAIGAFVVAVFGWMSAIVPKPKPDPAIAMKQELHEIANERKARIQFLATEVGERCDPPRVHQLMKDMVLDGQTDEARQFAAGYTQRCGEDPVVERWAKAPRPTSRR